MTARSADKKSTIKVYTPTSSDPITSHVNIPLLSVVAPPIPNEYIGVSPTGEIYRFGPRVTSTAPTTSRVSTGDSKSNSIWQEMFGRDAFLDDLAPPPPKVILPPTLAKPTDVFDGPSHTLPPVSLLFDAFMAQLLKPILVEHTSSTTTSTPNGRTGTGKGKGKANGTIIYEEEVVVPEKKGGQSHTKKVTDEDVKELEGFFKDLLSDTPTTQARSSGQASANRMANGDATTPTKLTLTSTPKPKAKANGTTTNTNGQAPTPRPEEGREKKNTKKRTAPKE